LVEADKGKKDNALKKEKKKKSFCSMIDQCNGKQMSRAFYDEEMITCKYELSRADS
jgi:hypothetical protein